MRKAVIFGLVLCLGLAYGIAQAQEAPAPAPAAAPAPAPTAKAPAAAPSLDVARMEVAGGVQNREPVGIANSFPASTQNVYCYVELKNVPQDTTITYVWTLGLNEMARVTQNVKKSWRWRTWSSKAIGGMKGNWKVDILDASGALLKSATFTVQ